MPRVRDGAWVFLGFQTYDEYLRSAHWRKFRKIYLKANRSGCVLCGNRTVDLHHITYANVGKETADDVMPLCRDHHDIVHLWLSASRWSVERSWDAVRQLQGRIGRKKESKPQKAKGPTVNNGTPHKQFRPAPVRPDPQSQEKARRGSMQREWNVLWRQLKELREMLPEDHEIVSCHPWDFTSNPFEKIKAMRLTVRMTRDAVRRLDDEDATARFPDTPPTFPRKTPSAAQSSDIR